MSSGLSHGMRVLRGCRALLAPSKSPPSAPSTAGAAPAKAKPTAKPKAESKAQKPTSSGSATEKVKKEPTRPSGILKVVQISPALGSFLGVSEASRADSVKQIWSYIKLHDLQNPANKREIYCDEKLKTIFDGREKVGFLEIGKLIARHFVKTD